MPTFENVACIRCGCVCDDLCLTVDGGRIVRAERACALAEPWLLQQDSRQPPVALIDGRAVPLDEGLDRAAAILRSASAPLVYGLSRSSTDGQRAAISLAERLGGVVDTTASLCHATSMMAIQEIGESTCTLGEVKNRADLVVYWGADPVQSHPRHMERYALWPPGRFVAGREARTLVVADVGPSASSALADLFVPIQPGADFDVLHTLRALVRGTPLRADADVGAPLPLLRELAERMLSSRFGIVFFGLGLSMTGAFHHNVEALLLLVRDLNGPRRFFARRLRVPGDVTGADTVLLWQTGYPFGVDLSRGYPRFNPGEFTANELLERGDVDACVLVGSEGMARFSAAATQRLQKIPTIVLDYPTEEPDIAPTVRFTTAVYGVHHTGTAYRMDGVPIPLRAVLPAAYPTDADILARLEERLPP